MINRVAEAVALLRAALIGEFGVDHSYIVCGKGKVLAASTKPHGVVPDNELNTVKFDIKD